MGIINQVAVLLQSSLGPNLDAIGRETGVIQRQRKFSGASLLKMLVLTVMKTPRPTTDDFVATAALLGVNVTPEAVEKRFTEKRVAHLRASLEQVVKSVVAAAPVAGSLLDKFTAVVIGDSTTVTLPDDFEAEFPGCGGKTGSGKAAVKIQVAWELRRGQLEKLDVHPGRDSDAKSVAVDEPVVPGSLTLRDLGYFCLKRFRSLGAQGAFWISRWQHGTAVFDAEGRRWEMGAFLQGQPAGMPVDVSIALGAEDRLECRLIALKVPPEVANRRRQAAFEKAQKHGRVPTQESLDLCDWTIFVTNCLATFLTWKEVVVLYRTRWQIELLFKLWKSHNHLAASRAHWTSMERLALFWAKLIGVVLQHWLLLTSNAADPRRSPWKAARVIRNWMESLTRALDNIDELIRTLRDMAMTIASVAQKKRQKKRPSLFQLLSDPELLEWNS